MNKSLDHERRDIKRRLLIKILDQASYTKSDEKKVIITKIHTL